MESVASQILSLLQLAGLSDDLDSIFPLRRRLASESASSGPITITINIPNGSCLVITWLDTDNIDTSVAATVEISGNNTAYPIADLGSVAEIQTLYVFPPGIATFTFNVTALPSTTALCRVSGFILPKEAVKKLSRIGLEIS